MNKINKRYLIKHLSLNKSIEEVREEIETESFNTIDKKYKLRLNDYSNILHHLEINKESRNNIYEKLKFYEEDLKEKELQIKKLKQNIYISKNLLDFVAMDRFYK